MSEFEGIDTEYTAIAAIRATKQVLVNQNGKQIRAIQGVRSLDKQLITTLSGILYQVNYLVQSSGQNNLLILIPSNLKFYSKVNASRI